ncbi:MAG: hypothetical protein Q7S45_01605 [Candidatus Curtissbacteria bacterium]|nr:hypothetical protein [Candidatus Curtissbacteria bacterium]
MSNFKNKIIFVAIFAVLGFLLLQLPVNNLIGTKARLTFFDMFYPISGAFLGGIWGMFAVSLMQVVNLAFHGFNGVKTTSILALFATIRLLPMIAGVLVFSKSGKKTLAIPAIAILAFLANPVGREVWYFTLFWFIPFVVWPFRSRFLVARSLATTFASHAVGGAVWVWAFPTTPAYWTMLIPIVALERSIFALGMSASYLLANNVAYFLQSKKLLPSGLELNRRYLALKK